MSFDITEARARYGTLLKISSSSGLFYFRLPSKAEFDTYNELVSTLAIPMLASDFLITKCLLYPLDIDIWAYEIIPIANLIVEKSGFHDIKQFEILVKSYREKADALGEKVISMILKAFPGYSLKQVEDMNAKDIARHLVLSEMILEQPTNLVGKPENPNDMSKTQQLHRDLSEKDKEQATKLRDIGKQALDSIKAR